MKKNVIYILIIGMVLCFQSCNLKDVTEVDKSPVYVTLSMGANGYQLYCDGKPYFIKGAGFEGFDPSGVTKNGGNTIRTWRTGDNFITGQQILDEAYKNGLMVCMGIEIGRERHGFDYDSVALVEQQFQFAKAEVMKYKDHPALLAWGIGNELNLHYSNPKVWDAVNEISLMIHKIDTNHLTTTMLAGAAADDIRMVTERAPSFDFLSFQLYGDIVNLPSYINNSGYRGAYVVSEWGATGHWEVGKTTWNQPIEQNSHVKALAYMERYEKVIAIDAFHCIGSFVFLWGQKQERTPTWYGMFLETGEKTESVDVMHYLWTGEWPENRSPQITSLLINNKTAAESLSFNANSSFEAVASASDPDNDVLRYRWEIMPEVPEHQQSDGGDFELRPTSVFLEDSKAGIMQIQVPATPGAYRLFVYIFDDNNSAATANIPFFVTDDN